MTHSVGGVDPGEDSKDAVTGTCAKVQYTSGRRRPRRIAVHPTPYMR